MLLILSRWTRTVVVPLAASFLLASSSIAEEPVPSAVEESVDVRLVLVEALVTDAAGRTVPDLTKEDFTLLVGYRPVAIDTLDVACDAGAMDDPEAGRGIVSSTPPRTLDPRRFAITLDWMNSARDWRPGMLDAARTIVRERKGPYDEVMLAIVGSAGLQIAQPFTRDAGALIATLDDIDRDPAVWAQPALPSLTGRPYFEALAGLLDVLEQYGGSKAVVLLSTWNAPSADNDLWFLDLAHRAAESRTAFYPVFAAGLQTSPDAEPFGGSPALVRIANESGGRYTRATNDVSLAYARAQRDLACRYTLGFYLRSGDARSRSRTITVRANRAGLRVRSPERLREWEPEERRRATERAAVLDPTHFRDGGVDVAAVPVVPRSGRAWQTLVSVSHPGSPGSGTGVPEARLSMVFSSLGRSSRVVETQTGSTLRAVETIDLAPGRWDVVGIYADTAVDRPRTGSARVEVPDVPDAGTFLTGPVLGGGGGEPVPHAHEVRGRLDLDGFRPLGSRTVRRGERITAVSHVCQVGPWPERTRFVVRRTIRDAEGRTVSGLDPVEVDLAGWKSLQCRAIVDGLSLERLPSGDYRFEVVLDDGAGTSASSAFRVADPDITSGTAPPPS